MTAYRILSGLPPYGPPAISFPDPNAFREGLVVQFAPDGSSPWIGNFQQFSAHLPNTVHIELGSSAVVVVAGGAGYVIDCEQRRLIRDFGIQIEHCWYQPDTGAVIISDGVGFEAFDATKSIWRSERVSWDGITILDRSTTMVRGEAYDPMSDRWQPFKLNVLNGAVEGGSYQNVQFVNSDVKPKADRCTLWHRLILEWLLKGRA